MCDKYNDAMMKYMDGNLDNAEEAKLRQHMDACTDCAEDFAAYSDILQGFDNMEIVEAPADFAPAVMAQVSSLNLYAPKVSARVKILDKLVFVPFVLLFIAAFGTVALAFFANPISIWLYEAGFYSLSTTAETISAGILSTTTAISDLVSGLGALSPLSMILYSGVFLLLFGALVALQFSLSPARSAPIKLRSDGE